jgi:hypothetical protein
VAQQDPEKKPSKKRIGRPHKPRTDEEQEQKRQQFLERNRVAAGKCRQRKKEKVEILERKCHDAQVEHEHLRGVRNQLQEDFQIFQRDLMTPCDCPHEKIATSTGLAFRGRKIEEGLEEERDQKDPTTDDSIVVGLVRRDSGFGEWTESDSDSNKGVKDEKQHT